MTKLTEPMLSELREEAGVTKRVLDRVPADKLSWRPHPKSMSLGQLALHVATIPGGLSTLAKLDEFDVANANFNPPEAKDLAELHAAFEQSIRAAEDCLSGMSDQAAMGNWRLMSRGQEAFSMPRVVMLRSIMLNHWYHHRGQLTVYLRLLDVPVPVIYGRSADEDPFA